MLVADDTRSVALRLSELIAEAGQFAIAGPAFDGAQAMALFAATRPDAAVLDFTMPRATGLDVLRAIREAGSDCLVIVMTNQTDPSIRERCLAAGADHFLLKSQDIGIVVEILRDHFARY
ncbi:response regulator [Novosphingobium album (ex Liu et al. 2023)]|uniref:Response regulator n=1 Tax=Novosphingobium album (ex Liu et al. 2023) TaxID=3031130 RepID=A0ABT5WVT8_9SPHN|nr:response regulator [Novosphingobium album (ex Liu et al. 2023)]MDE8654018.1 response regulator [Novosphingobium album (ex Liu et al. 2023)]